MKDVTAIAISFMTTGSGAVVIQTAVDTATSYVGIFGVISGAIIGFRTIVLRNRELNLRERELVLEEDKAKSKENSS